MKALTLIQPFASLVAIEAKLNETRSWPTNYRGPLAIHAAKHFPEDYQGLCFFEPFRSILAKAGFITLNRTYLGDHNFPLGCVVAICKLLDCRYILKPGQLYLDPEIKPFILPEEPELSFGDYTPGRFVFSLSEIQQLANPIPARGYQKLWEWASYDYGVALNPRRNYAG
jgi:hypothetical protein